MRAACLFLPLLLFAAEPPQAELHSGSLRARVYLPDPTNGFYRGTRFDWSGMVETVQYGGHTFYGRWFQATDPGVHDFEYRGAEIVAGPNTAATGPAEEFNTNNKALAYDEAKPGGTFIKIGAGVLRRPDERDYDRFRLYEVVNPGTWTNRIARNSAEFIQQLNDPSSGYGYAYHKNVRLVGSSAELHIAHTFRNTGKRTISSRVYNHIGNEDRLPFDYDEVLALAAPKAMLIVAPIKDRYARLPDVQREVEAAARVYRLLGRELEVWTPDDFNRFPLPLQQQVYDWLAKLP
ncbi:MAG TPA: hypothetical protein VFL57_03075 [Bryobacteraceae bacterium]|nr:hypothetical protein [Bryobacteraceae bacterium]